MRLEQLIREFKYFKFLHLTLLPIHLLQRPCNSNTNSLAVSAVHGRVTETMMLVNK